MCAQPHLAVLDPEKKSLNGLFSLLNIRHPKKFKSFSHWPSKQLVHETVKCFCSKALKTAEDPDVLRQISFDPTSAVNFSAGERTHETHPVWLTVYKGMPGGLMMTHWLVVSTHLKNISQIGSFPQKGMRIKNI